MRDRDHGLLHRSPILPAHVVAVRLPASLLETLRAAAAPGTVVVVHSLADASRELRRMESACLLYAVPSAAESSEAAHIETVIRGFPRCTAIAMFSTGVSSPAFLLRLSSVLTPEVLALATFPDEGAMRASLRRRAAEHASRDLLTEAELNLSDAMATVFAKAVVLAHRPLSVRDLASAARMPERSLREFCTQHQLPGPQMIIGWARLLLACYYLDEPARTVESISEMLEFPAASSLRNQIHRYTGHTTSALRKLGAVSIIARAIEQAAVSGDARRHERRTNGGARRRATARRLAPDASRA